MKREKLAVVRGSGNVFRDLGNKSADAEQFKATSLPKSSSRSTTSASPSVPPMPAPASPQPTSPASATRTWAGSP